MPRRRLLLVYHFFHPDDVVSARHFRDLAEEQKRRGWDVTVLTSDRSCRNKGQMYSRTETWNGIKIVRSHRPDWDQARALPRLANSVWMIASWAIEVAMLGEFDAIVIGSEPAFSPALVLALKALRRRTRYVHWCFDMYPEAIEADGAGGVTMALMPWARRLMAAAYRRYDALVDLGPTMARRLRAHGSRARHETLIPWALVEPDEPPAVDPRVRAQLFPRARLGLLYSGTMGRAHDYEILLELARRCRARSGDQISLCFSSRGNRYEQLRAAVTGADTNISFAPFCDEEELERRLGAADVHVMSLKPEWSGVVVPSKFFGSLATGKPVLYAGPEDSDVAKWIAELDVGFTVSRASLDAAVERLGRLLTDETRLKAWSARAFRIYNERFSKDAVNDAWASLLRDMTA